MNGDLIFYQVRSIALKNYMLWRRNADAPRLRFINQPQASRYW